MNNDNATCSECGGPAELEYDDDSIAYAHCMEPCWECQVCFSTGNTGYGHNARPLVDGRCCDECNNQVIAFRLTHILGVERAISSIATHSEEE